PSNAPTALRPAARASLSPRHRVPCRCSAGVRRQASPRASSARNFPSCIGHRRTASGNGPSFQLTALSHSPPPATPTRQLRPVACEPPPLCQLIPASRPPHTVCALSLSQPEEPSTAMLLARIVSPKCV